MPLLPLFVFLFYFILSVNGGFLPEYNDPIHGQLIVSHRYPPFLTLKAHPNREYYIPTDQQVAEIRAAVFSGTNRFQVVDGFSNSSDYGRLRLKRSAVPEPRIGGDSEMTLSIDDFNAGMKTFNLYQLFVGKLIISMFKAYIDKPPLPDFDAHIPFSTFNEKTYFKATIVPSEKMPDWLVDLRKSLEAEAAGRPYFPIDKVLNELRECRSVGYSQMSSKDFKFKTGELGGMVYYQVQCMRIKTDMFVFFSLNDNAFELKPEVIHNARTCTGYHFDGCHWFCWFCYHSPYYYDCSFSTEKDRVITAAQQRELNDYLIDKVVQRVKIDFKDKIDAARADTTLTVPCYSGGC